jgi:hypothetical protein
MLFQLGTDELFFDSTSFHGLIVKRRIHPSPHHPITLSPNKFPNKYGKKQRVYCSLMPVLCYFYRMYGESELADKLKKIEALFAGTPERGEKLAAMEAAQRIKERLASMEKTDEPIEYTFHLTSMWAKKLFTALLRRYGIKPYRYRRQKYTTVMARIPVTFADTVLWPEFLKLNEVLSTYINDITDRVISEHIFSDSSDAEIE